jgi:hypothetical protein
MSTLKVDYLINRLGTGAPQLTYGATIPAGQDLSVGGDLTVTGNLTVNGTTTTVNTANTTITDSLLELNSGAASNTNDLGLIFERGSTGDNAALLWDESVDKFALGTTTATGASTGDLTLTTATLVANLEGSQSGGSIDATTITGSSDLAINTNTLFVDASEAYVGIRSTSPPSNFVAALDIQHAGTGSGGTGTSNVTLCLGGDDGGATSRTDATAKQFRVGMPHYTNTEELMGVMYGESNGSQNYLTFGGSNSTSFNFVTHLGFAVGTSHTTASTGSGGLSECQLRLVGKDYSGNGYLQLYNSAISETFSGDFSSQLSGTPSFDVTNGTTRYYGMNGNITRIDFTNVDTANSRATTFQLYLSASSAYTIASTNGVAVNGGAAQKLRFPNGATSISHSGIGIDVLTVVITVDSGGVQRVFGFLSKGH